MSVNHLLLIWKSPATRSRHIVGDLVWDGDAYHFTYRKGSQLDPAKREGFVGHPAFSNLDEHYKSSALFEAFLCRIPQKDNPMMRELIEFYNIDTTAHMDLLNISGGRLATDTFETIQPFDSLVEEDNFKVIFPVAGVRYHDFSDIEDAKKLQKGQILTLRSHKENKFDPHAVHVLNEEEKILGFIPAYYSRYIDSAIHSDESEVRAVIKDVLPPLHPESIFIEVSGRISGYSTTNGKYPWDLYEGEGLAAK